MELSTSIETITHQYKKAGVSHDTTVHVWSNYTIRM